METRETYKTFADEPSQSLFMVELIDAHSGKSHGYIGYRFHAVGAQAAADSWNNNRDRGDLVAVIKPVQEPTPPVQHAQIVKARRDHLALEEIGKLLGMRVIEREDRSVIIDNVRKLAEAIKNPIESIDSQIESLEARLQRLKRARSILSKARGTEKRLKRSVAKASKPKAADSKLAYWDEIEELIFANVAGSAEKLTCSDVANTLGLSYTTIGKAVSNSKRLEKQGSYIVVLS